MENNGRLNNGRFAKGHVSWLKGLVGVTKAWNKGKKMSQEARINMSIARKGKPAPYKGLRPWLRHDKPHSEESKLKMSISHLKTVPRGKMCHLYKNGKYTKENRARYWHDVKSYRYRKWRISVYERDNYTCQSCGKVGNYLTAHHIKSYALFPELRYKVDNGITLCEECHKLTDNYKGRGVA